MLAAALQPESDATLIDTTGGRRLQRSRRPTRAGGCCPYRMLHYVAISGVLSVDHEQNTGHPWLELASTPSSAEICGSVSRSRMWLVVLESDSIAAEGIGARRTERGRYEVVCNWHNA